MLILSFNKCLLGPTVPASLDTTFNLPLKEALSPPRYRRARLREVEWAARGHTARRRWSFV